MNELYWYDHLEAANKKCRQTGDDETFTADEIESIWECLEMRNERYDEWEENTEKLRAEIAQRNDVIQKLEEENKLLCDQVEQLSTINERYKAVVKALVEDGVDTGLILFGNDGAEKAADRIKKVAEQALNKMTESQSPHDQETAG